MAKKEDQYCDLCGTDGHDEKDHDELGIRIGSKEEKNWDSILKQSEELIMTGEASLEINKMIVKLAKKNIELEKEKFK
jgi:hypothetical protein